MSRHNRRRTRGGHRNKSLTPHWSTFEDSAFQSSIEPPLNAMQGSSLRYLSFRGGNNLVVRHWQDRHTVWQARELRKREEFEAQKSRLFGEADGSEEDEGLCVKMQSYFDGLDFIDG